uniref:Cytochrome b5 heme-binding domain-containing protein n=2 Tax=Macrostomum lignano TaxID=282301 RepID=A0A1I8G598_9PLAT
MDRIKGYWNTILSELSSPLNLALVGICAFLTYKIFFGRSKPELPPPKSNRLPKMKKRDFTRQELARYNGVDNDEKRILIAIRGTVFDVSNRGRDFYGPGGPYEDLAGRDASRALATFSLNKDAFKDEVDDLSDLDSFQVESLDNWEQQFKEKYDTVGKLLKPGEQPTEYPDSDGDGAEGHAKNN